MKIRGKTFVVTGAGGGIGGELALGILARGGRVAGVDLREDGMQSIKTQAGDAGEHMSAHPLNITDRPAVEALPQQVLSSHDSIDGVINCAGIIQPFVKVNELDYQAIERVMNVNFYGTLYMTKTFLPHLLAQPEAHLVNVSSMGGFLPVPGQSIYGASKAAVKLLTEGLYAELLDTPVHVSIVFPGATKTEITQNSAVETPNIDGKAKEYPTLSASDAAKIILDGIEANKPQIFTGKDSKMMNRLYRLNPVYATKLIAGKMKSLLT